MKKILATLLVATMLLSCMSAVVLAASELSTPSSVVFSSATKTTGYGSNKTTVFDEEVTAFYYTNGYSYIQSDDDYNAAKMLQAMDGVLKGDTAAFDAYGSKFTFSAGEYVMLPYIVTDVMSINITLEYNETEFMYVGEVVAAGKSGKYNADNKTLGISSDSNFTGVFGATFFKVLDGTGDENGDKKATISYTVNEAKGSGNVNATATATALTYDLKLTPGSTPTLPNATDSDLGAAVPGFTGEDGHEYAVEYGTNIVCGDEVEYDYSKYGIYKVYFSKFVDTGVYAQPKAQGIKFNYINKKGEPVELKLEARTAFKSGDPFGILVFGMGPQTELTATPYIEYAE